MSAIPPHRKRRIALAVLFVLGWTAGLQAAPCIRDVALIIDSRTIHLSGYGLVVGLQGAGDGQGTRLTRETLTAMLRRLGVDVDSQTVQVGDVAAVMVTSALSPDVTVGERFDVTVASMGDARNLRGGTLLPTRLVAADGTVYATAQGTVVRGTHTDDSGDSTLSLTAARVGRIVDGATLEIRPVPDSGASRVVGLTLADRDPSLARRVVAAITDRWGPVASVTGVGSIRVDIPAGLSAAPARDAFIAELSALPLESDPSARVVLDRKTASIVTGAEILVAPAAVERNGITVQVGAPAGTDVARAATVRQVVNCLVNIGTSPRDVIAVIRALRDAGALGADVVVL